MEIISLLNLYEIEAMFNYGGFYYHDMQQLSSKN